jgi:L-histidine N-alpha-methyltransferase
MLLLGLDMVKSKDILEKAYNDSRNVTEKFNKNILKVVNKFVNTNFDPDDFEHMAFYNAEQSRIEMYLKALKNIEISSPHFPDKIFIKRGETIHTENSYKYTHEYITNLALTSGLKIESIFIDKKKWFSVIQFKKKQ